MIERIVSGGQTGADRAALDFAIQRDIPHGGWCPRGRLAEDGIIPARYLLNETPNENSVERTEWNVRDSDGTVIFSIGVNLIGGSRETMQFALQYHKPWLHLARERDGGTAVVELKRFLEAHGIKTLNVAGSRASEEPEVGRFTPETLEGAI